MQSSAALIRLAAQAGASILSRQSALSCLWELTYRCNARCPMCAYWQHPTAPAEEMDLPSIRAGLVKVHAHGCRFINFTGGEPTVRQDLEDIVSAAAGLGIWSSIVTNGTTLTRERLRRLRDAGLDNLLVSLDSSDPAAHDANRGVPGLHRRVLEIADWLAADFLSRHRTGGFMSVLRATNLHEAPDIVRLAEERGVYVILQPYHANKTGDASPVPVFSRAQAADLLSLKRSPALLSSRGYLRGIVGQRPPSRECHAGRKYFSVDPFGYVHPCVDMPAAGHVLRDDLSVLRSGQAREAVDRCSGCWYCFRGEARADTLFLAMFLGAAAIEANGAPREAAYAFAAQWRHGMAGNSPLYMPGFFAAAVALWFWSMDRRTSCVIVERTILLAASLALAVMTAPYGADLALRSFHGRAGTLVSSPREIPLALASFHGAYTLVAWSTFVIGSRVAIERRSVKPLAPALAASLLLVVVRTWTVDEFGSFWWRRTLAGDPIAVCSSAVVAVTAGVLAASALARGRTQRDRDAENPATAA